MAHDGGTGVPVVGVTQIHSTTGILQTYRLEPCIHHVQYSGCHGHHPLFPFQYMTDFNPVQRSNGTNSNIPLEKPGHLNMAPRLPKNVRPTSYSIHLDIDLDNLTFEGQVKTSIEVLIDRTTSIVLHSKDLEILETELYIKSPPDFYDTSIIPEVEHNTETSTITVSLPYSTLDVGDKVKLIQRFKGTIQGNGQVPGLQWADYKTTPDGEPKKAIYTTCEPIGARTIFPCFDEPQLKADIHLSVKVNKPGLTILSNRERHGDPDYDTIYGLHVQDGDENDKPESERDILPCTEARFRPIHMSTYLFVLVIGEFEYIESRTRDGESATPFPIRLYALKGAHIERGCRMLGVAIEAMSQYQKFFGTDYPLDKLDLVAFPDAGGLENWGCVVFGERFLLLDEKETSARSWQTAVETLCHELAHQWFGNLVTMEWWDDLWLSEAFAQWAGFYVVNLMFPSWGYPLHFVAADPDPEAMAFYQGALELDSSTGGSHPLYNPDASPDRFHELFDNITYMKGAVVVGLLYDRIGPKYFRRGIKKYFELNAWKNATHEDLWDALEGSSKPGTDVRGFMEKWTKQVGYPLVVISEREKGEDGGDFLLEQHRYFQLSEPDFRGKEEKKDDLIYPIVVEWPELLQEEEEEHHLLDTIGLARTKPFATRKRICTHPTTTDNENNPANWKINRQQIGLYRVSYPRWILQKFRAALLNPKDEEIMLKQPSRSPSVRLFPADVVGLISDQLALVSCYSRDIYLPEANRITTADLLGFILDFSNHGKGIFPTDTDHDNLEFLVWRQVFATVVKLKQAFLFAPSSERILVGLQRFHRYLVDIIHPSHDKRYRQGEEEDDDDDEDHVHISSTGDIDIKFGQDITKNLSSQSHIPPPPPPTVYKDPIQTAISNSLTFSQATLHPSHTLTTLATSAFDKFITNNNNNNNKTNPPSPSTDPNPNPNLNQSPDLRLYLNPNTRKYIFQSVIRNNTPPTNPSRFNEVLNLSLTTASPEIRTDAFVSLGYATHPELLTKVMKLMTDENAPFYWLERWFLLNALQRWEYPLPVTLPLPLPLTRSQVSSSSSSTKSEKENGNVNVNGNDTSKETENQKVNGALGPRIRRRETGAEISWKWLTTNWNEITTGKTKVGPGTIAMYLSSCVSCFSTRGQLDAVRDFKEGVDEKYHKAFDDAIEGIKARNRWVERDHGVVDEWLVEHGFLSVLN